MFFKRPLLALLPLIVLFVSATPSWGQPNGAYPDGQYSPSPAPYPVNAAAPVYPPGMQPPTAVYPGPAMPGAPQPAVQATAAQQAPRTLSVVDWFKRYDQIRYHAQMTPVERQRADAMMSKGLSVLIPGEEKQATQALLISLVKRYQQAQLELKSMPMIKPTQELHRGYYQYFATAAKLFQDYVAVQDNLFITDANGQSVTAGLLPRKQALATLEGNVKALDAQLRQQYNIAPYPY